MRNTVCLLLIEKWVFLSFWEFSGSWAFLWLEFSATNIREPPHPWFFSFFHIWAIFKLSKSLPNALFPLSLDSDKKVKNKTPHRIAYVAQRLKLGWRSASIWDIINTQNCLFSNFNGTNLIFVSGLVCFSCEITKKILIGYQDQIDHYQQFWLVVTTEQYNVIFWWLLLIYFQNQDVMIIFAKSTFVFGIEKQRK